MARPPNMPTPCGICPKKSPQEAHNYELSDKNIQAWQFYYQVRAMGATEAQKQDPVLARNMTIIDKIIRPHEAEMAALSLAPFLVKP